MKLHFWHGGNQEIGGLQGEMAATSDQVILTE
jgi:hypothetical protein